LNTSRNDKILIFICLAILFTAAAISSTAADARPKVVLSKTHLRARHLQSLVVEVQDPGCPACLKTLQKYLLKLKGVDTVALPRWRRTLTASTSGKARAPQLIVINFSARSVSKTRLLERIKAHDLKVISVRAVR